MQPLDPDSAPTPEARLRAGASRWIVARERGFTTAEAREFERWLAVDPRHAAALDEASAMWEMLDEIPARTGEPIVAKSRRRASWPWPILGGLAAAAAVTLSYLIARGPTASSQAGREHPTVAATAASATPQTQVLADGTQVRLNVGAEFVEEFSVSERRVRLMRGEAYFIVTKDPARPFIVQAGAITIRAVGTAFNVCWKPAAIDVLVTEGTVQVNPQTTAHEAEAPSAEAPLVVAGHRASVDLAAVHARPRVIVSKVNHAVMTQTLAWHEPLRRLGATLVELAGDFERQTGRRLVVADPELRELQVGGRFRGDDLEGLLRLLEENYGIAVERSADGSVVLRKSGR